MNYPDGRRIAIGDRVALSKRERGTVVCSIDTGEFTSEYPEAEWSYLERGILIKSESGELFHYPELDEDFAPMTSEHNQEHP